MPWTFSPKPSSSTTPAENTAYKQHTRRRDCLHKAGTGDIGKIRDPVYTPKPSSGNKLHEWQKCSAYSYKLRIRRTVLCISSGGPLLGPPGRRKLHEWQKCSAFSFSLRIRRTFLCVSRSLRRLAGRAAAPSHAGHIFPAPPFFAADPLSPPFPACNLWKKLHRREGLCPSRPPPAAITAKMCSAFSFKLRIRRTALCFSFFSAWRQGRRSLPAPPFYAANPVCSPPPSSAVFLFFGSNVVFVYDVVKTTRVRASPHPFPLLLIIRQIPLLSPPRPRFL